MRWLDFLFPPRSDEAILRGVSRDAFLALLSPRLVEATRPAATALLPFNDTRVRAAIHEAKYRRSEEAFALLAAVLIEYLRDADMSLEKARLIPIPLGNERRKERGYNQTEEIARRAADELELSIDTTALVRTRETTSQISLPRRERVENMRDAFRAAHVLSAAYTYIVLDDVVTTGATLQAAVDALVAAGAAHIIPIALAH